MSTRITMNALLVLGMTVISSVAYGQSQVNPPRTSSAPPQPQPVTPAERDATREDRASDDRNAVIA
jgi:hypothetical protein